MKIKILLLSLVLFSCSDNWYLKKAIEKNPEAFRDTIITQRIDTVYIPVGAVDTLFKLQRDTIIEYRIKAISGQDVKVKYLYRTKIDSFFLEVECPDQKTITVTETKQLPPVIIQQTWGQKIKYTIFVVLGVLLLILLLRVFRR